MQARYGLGRIAGALQLGALSVLAACGGSGGGDLAASSGCDTSDPATSANCGNVIVALTDADGDFTSYTVDVLSISLERDNGTRIEMLPAAVRVDFAELAELSELISAATVVPGNFVGGSIRIDYSDAEIYVEAGSAIVAANVYDENGTLLTADTPDSVVEMEIRLPSTERLVVTRGRTALLSIDFDLAVSHVVDTTQSPVHVVARPYLVAEVRPVDQKEIRVRGALVDVDVDAGTYAIRLMPWHHRLGDWGIYTVSTTNATEYEIDSETYIGRDGLEALAAEPPGTITVAFGTLSLIDRQFTAAVVHAGDSVGGERWSAVLGNIVSRNGDRLVMKGVIAIRRDRRTHFHRTVIIDVGPDTGVTRIGDPDGSYDKDDLSVGQRAIVFGDFTNPLVDNSDRFGPDIALMLDATNGRARMLTTSLTGRVVATAPGHINVALRAIDRLGIDLFDFSGTGITPETDADPSSYEIATSTLSLAAIELDRGVRVLGFVTAFGAAPPDFEGRTLIGPRELPATLGVGWGIDGTAAAFSVMGPQSLVVDLANPDIGLRHHMLVGHELIDLFDLPASPLLEESGPPRIYGIWEPGHIELFNDFADFTDELAVRLSAADRARSLTAYGRYSNDSNSLAANRIVVQMLPAGTP